MSEHGDTPFESIGKVLLPARDPSRTLSVHALSRMLPQGSRLFTLRCHFDEGGPWAGMRDFFRELLPGPDSGAAELLDKHDYELAHLLPDLKPALGIRNPCLTDLASNEERVRNYPADRALRIVHGLVDLLIALKEREDRSAHETWILLCADYDCAGHMTKVFMQELMRRAGARLRLLLIPLISGSEEPDFPAAVSCRTLPFGIEALERPQVPDKNEAAELAKALEAQVDDDILLSTGQTPEVLRLWKIAERPNKVFEWQYKALLAFNTLGLYVDAIRYGESAREYFKRAVNQQSIHARSLRWGIFFKLFMCYLGINALDTAQRLAKEDIPADDGDGQEAAMRVRVSYLMAMLHARYLPVRDFSTGEQYLELGLTYLSKATLPESERYFLRAFNRNGLAMIRSFQGHHQEALDLCWGAWELLDKHLDSTKHRLHRSVLLYNMAQVYTHTQSFDLAIEHYSAAMRMDPNYSEYYNERGNLLLKLGRLDEADWDYRRAIALGPPYFEVWSNLGQCCRIRGHMEEAIAAYDRSLDLQPNQPMVWVVRAQALEALGRLDQAIDSYSQALSLSSTLWPALAGRAVLLYEQGKVNDCLTDLDRAVALAPDRPDLYQNRAVAHADLGRYQEASCDLQRYLELQPDADDRAEVEARLRDLASTLSPAVT
ncbi:MAG TPA: tetratricopeptide repeat protein [Thermoanaerobaculia bacterium]|nr:tetratricopeptide repeat protein [Thermoanaerobaculia bacterium]